MGAKILFLTLYSNVSAPGPVIVTALCSAVVWQAPAMPNGVITRYEVDLGGAVMPLPADRFFFVTSEQQQNSNVPARVCCVLLLSRVFA